MQKNIKKQILRFACIFMFLFGVLFIGLTFSRWGMRLEAAVDSLFPGRPSSVGIVVFLGYWVVDFFLFLLVLGDK